MRNNQNQPFEPVFRKSRKRIEILFAQLCDQFMLKRNYAKSLTGLANRIFAKLVTVTFLQTFNLKNGRTINLLKHALAF